MNTLQKLDIESLADVSVESFLQMLRQKGAIAVRFADGKVAIVQLQPELPPLPILEGSVPRDWKDSIYEH